MQKKLVYSAICVALAILLSNIKLFTMPQGGSVSACSMLFISLVGYWFGVKAGVIAGVVTGLLQLLFGAYIVHPAQLILDYILAFGVIGISGFFRNTKHGLYTGYIAGATARFVCSFISGFIFFGSYAPEGMGVFVYTLVYNLSYILPEMVITLLLISVPAFKNAIMKVKNELEST